MPAIPVLIAILQGVIPLIQAAPALIAEIKAFIGGLNPNSPMVTAAQEAQYNALLVAINAQVQAL